MYGSHDDMIGSETPSEPPEQCAVVAARLDAYHDGLLPAEDARTVVSHVASCAQCAARLDAVAAADSLIRSAPAPHVGPELRHRLYERIAMARYSIPPSTPIRSIRISETTMSESGSRLSRAAATPRVPRRLNVWLSGVAAALVVALLAGVFLAQGHGSKHPGPLVGSGGPTTGLCASTASKANIPANAYLADLAMTSADEGWAVGGILNADHSWAQSLILHFSHCQWTQVGPTIANVGLSSISMDAPTDGWITGSSYGSASVLLHYSGGRWQQKHVATLENATGYFGNVRMLSPTDGWIVIEHAKDAHGLITTALAHEHNGAWSVLMNTPFALVTDVSPVGPDDAWVIGTASDSDPTGILAHYKAGQWVATVPMGGTVDSSHLSLRMVSPAVGWAMAEAPGPGGNYFEAVETPLVLRYDGTTWKSVHIGANPAAQRVYMFGANEGWAFQLSHQADNADPGNLTISQAQYESGGTWRAAKITARSISDIYALSRVSAGEYWAIGSYQFTMHQSLLLHFANDTWTQYGQ